jgi:hypothetical protein
MNIANKKRISYQKKFIGIQSLFVLIQLKAHRLVFRQTNTTVTYFPVLERKLGEYSNHKCFVVKTLLKTIYLRIEQQY